MAKETRIRSKSNIKKTLKQRMIFLEQVIHKFPHSGVVLDHVSFQIDDGQIFTLLGPNGAGKSTLVRILATLIVPTSGRINVCGYDVVRDAAKVRKCIAVCSDSERSFYFRLTGYQNLEFFGGLTGYHSRKELKRCIIETMELVGLTEARNKLFMQYSHGMRKRLSLARCLLRDASVFLLDEPTSGVDPSGAVAIRKILEDLRAKGKTILLTTHNLEEASRISDCVGILKDGKLAVLDSPENLKKIVEKKKIIIVLQSPKHASEVADKLRNLPTLSNIRWEDCQVEIKMEQGFPITPVLKVIMNDGIRVETVYEKQATLEDLFIRIAEQKDV